MPIEGVTSELLLEKMKGTNKSVKTKEETIKWIENDFTKRMDREFGTLLITAGAGDIDTLVEKIRESLNRSR